MPYAFISRFENFPVADLADLRRRLEKYSKRSLVVKHTLAQRIFGEMNYQGAAQMLKGHVLVTFSDKEPQALSKAIVEYAKGNEKFSPAGVIFEKKVYNAQFVNQLAALPSRHELLTQAVIRIKSPISGFVMTLGQVVRGLVQVLSEVKKKREAASSAA